MYVTPQECVDLLLHKWIKANSVVSPVRLSEPLFVFNPRRFPAHFTDVPFAGVYPKGWICCNIVTVMKFATSWIKYHYLLLQISNCHYHTLIKLSRGLPKHLLLISSKICSCLQRSAPVKSWPSKNTVHHQGQCICAHHCLHTSRYYFCHTVKSTFCSYRSSALFIYRAFLLINMSLCYLCS